MQTPSPSPTTPIDAPRIATGLDRLTHTLAVFDLILRNDTPVPAGR